MDYSKFVSAKSSRRQPSAIRALQKYLTVPGMVYNSLFNRVLFHWLKF
jgi:hypothetical protein